MKTMGLSDLCLVAPKDFPSPDAEKMAAGAQDVLKNVTLATDLSSAIEDCTVVVASTARPRGYDLPELTPAQTADKLLGGAASSPVALIFGPERMGLHNDDIQLAKYRVTIPANPDYSSLNMAAAVQTLSYEIYSRAITQQASPPENTAQLPTSAEIEMLYQHLERVLKLVRFLRPHQGETLQRIRHMLNRAEPTAAEVNILRGILNSIERSVTSHSTSNNTSNDTPIN